METSQIIQSIIKDIHRGKKSDKNTSDYSIDICALL